MISFPYDKHIFTIRNAYDINTGTLSYKSIKKQKNKSFYFNLGPELCKITTKRCRVVRKFFFITPWMAAMLSTLRTTGVVDQVIIHFEIINLKLVINLNFILLAKYVFNDFNMGTCKSSSLKMYLFYKKCMPSYLVLFKKEMGDLKYQPIKNQLPKSSDLDQILF